VPPDYAVGTRFLTTPTDCIPWNGYYILFNNVNLSVRPIYGVWFEIRHCNNTFKAYRVARDSLKLRNDPADRINMMNLRASGELTGAEL
jgi:hypothetical protein